MGDHNDADDVPPDDELGEPVDPSVDQQAALMEAIENQTDEGSSAAGA